MLPSAIKKLFSILYNPIHFLSLAASCNEKANDCTEAKPNAVEEKKMFRKMMKHKLSEYEKDFLKMQSHAENAYNSFINSSLYQECRTILAFVSSGFEMDTKALIKKALADGKRVAVPRIIPNTCDMDFYFLDGNEKLDSQLERSSFNLQEPKASLEKLEVQCLPIHTVILLPGLAFSHSGARLGRGKGFYDRYIEKLYAQTQVIHLPTALIGWGFEAQVFDEIPFGEHDIMLTHLVTEKGLSLCE